MVSFGGGGKGDLAIPGAGCQEDQAISVQAGIQAGDIIHRNGIGGAVAVPGDFAFPAIPSIEGDLRLPGCEDLHGLGGAAQEPQAEGGHQNQAEEWFPNFHGWYTPYVKIEGYGS